MRSILNPMFQSKPVVTRRIIILTGAITAWLASNHATAKIRNPWAIGPSRPTFVESLQIQAHHQEPLWLPWENTVWRIQKALVSTFSIFFCGEPSHKTVGPFGVAPVTPCMGFPFITASPPLSPWLSSRRIPTPRQAQLSTKHIAAAHAMSLLLQTTRDLTWLHDDVKLLRGRTISAIFLHFALHPALPNWRRHRGTPMESEIDWWAPEHWTLWTVSRASSRSASRRFLSRRFLEPQEK